MKTSITWLHLSDLHSYKLRDGWDSERILTKLLDDLQEMQSEHGLKPDFIAFTGDAAFGHVKDSPGHSISDQFDEAHHLFNNVRSAFNPQIPLDRFFIIPGNHDVNRQAVTPDQIEWLDNQKDINSIISLMQNNARQWQRYMERLTDYTKFLNKYGYIHLLRDPEHLIYSNIINIEGVEIGIAGFNSAWSCSREDEKGKLWMGGRWQIEQLLTKIGKARLKIALVHHPSNWLVGVEDPHFHRQIAIDFDFCLHGHEHQDWVEQIDSHIRIAAGASYEHSQSTNGYNFVRVNLEDGTGEVWLRHYDNRGGGWIPANVYQKTNNDGLWGLNLPKITNYSLSSELSIEKKSQTDLNVGLNISREPTTSIIKTRDMRRFKTYGSDLPPIVDAWVGREQELLALNRLKNGIVVVTGIGGQGKSTLIAKFLEEWRLNHSDGFWDWRDCREEGERFHTQLMAFFEHITDGEITGTNLAGADTKEIVKYLFQIASDKPGILLRPT